jgi:all-trans-8'-apo-beta-carotenal 15,15'-oxygenase
LNYVGSHDDNFLAGAAFAIMRCAHVASGESRMRTATLNRSTGKVRVTSFDNLAEEFSRLKPRFVGAAARFHGVQVRDVGSRKTTRFDYGDDFTVEEHIVVARPGSTRETDSWIIGSAFDTKSQRTCVNVFDAGGVNNGPVARAWLPHWLSLAFHGNFTAAWWLKPWITTYETRTTFC